METIKKANVPMCLLLLTTIRMMFPDASLSLALFGLGITSLFAYKQYLDKRFTKSLDQSLKEELDNIKSVVSGLAAKQVLRPQNKDQRFF